MSESTITIISSSYQLDDEERDMILKRFSFIDKDHCRFVIDKTVLAGVVINVGDEVIDMSLKTKLLNLKKKLYGVDK